jgi:hypothetical protein
MPANKNAWLRYLIIIRTIKNGGATKNEIIEAIREELGMYVSVSTIEKDMQFLKFSSEFGIYAPITYRKHGNGYWLPPNWSMSEAIQKAWKI